MGRGGIELRGLPRELGGRLARAPRGFGHPLSHRAGGELQLQVDDIFRDGAVRIKKVPRAMAGVGGLEGRGGVSAFPENLRGLPATWCTTAQYATVCTKGYLRTQLVYCWSVPHTTPCSLTILTLNPETLTRIPEP